MPPWGSIQALDVAVALALLYAILSIVCCAPVVWAQTTRRGYRAHHEYEPEHEHRYRREQFLMRRSALLISIVVVLALNADSLGVAERTWRNDAVESAFLSSQQPQPTASPDDAATEAETVEELGLPIGWSDETTPDDTWGFAGKGAGLLTTILVLSLTVPWTLRLATEPDRRALQESRRRELEEQTKRAQYGLPPL